ncbi:hypothetical protein SRO_3783 [Streptomyces rochei]|nr:hypothetical protein SRO_3783 [Streptomyces rochei]
MSGRSAARPAGLVGTLLALAASEFGDKLVQVAYALIAVRAGSTTFLASVLAAQTIPVLALTPLVSSRGWIRSRTAWRAGLIGQVAAFAVAGAVADHRIAVLACILVAASCEALTMPFSRSLLHALSDGRQAELAKWWSVSKAGAGAAGMVLAGVVVAVSGAASAFALNALTFLLVLAVAWSPRIPQDGTAGSRGATAGFGRLLAPGAFGALGLLCVTVMLITTSLEGVSGPFMLARTPGYDAHGLGVVMACWAVASMVAAAVTPRRLTGIRALLPLSDLLVALAIGLPSLGLPFWSAAVTFALGGHRERRLQPPPHPRHLVGRPGRGPAPRLGRVQLDPERHPAPELRGGPLPPPPAHPCPAGDGLGPVPTRGWRLSPLPGPGPQGGPRHRLSLPGRAGAGPHPSRPTAQESGAVRGKRRAPQRA